MAGGRHGLIVVPTGDGVNDTIPTVSDTERTRRLVRHAAVSGCGGTTALGPVRWAAPDRKDPCGRTHRRHPSPAEINVEVADDTDRDALRKQVEAALTGALDVLWLTDRRGREIGVAAAKIAYVEVGAADGERRIGFGG